jgi:hypothetical protein
MLGAVFLERNRGELTPIVSAQDAQMLACLHLHLHLHLHLKLLDGGEQGHPHVPSLVINQQKKILLTTGCDRRDGAAQVASYILESWRVEIFHCFIL